MNIVFFLGAKLKAAVLRAFGERLDISALPLPVPAAGEVLIRTAGCGICRTDLHMMHGSGYRPALPHVLGHEPAGMVEALGEGVTGIKVGSRAAVYLFQSCDECEACTHGSHAQCANVSGILGITRNGGFAEYFLAPAANILSVPTGLDLATAGLVSCAAVTAVRAVDRAALMPGHRVAVIGAGGIGVLVIQLLSARGLEVHAITRSSEGQRASLDAGATAAIHPDAAEAGMACHRVFDLVGTAATMALAARILTRQGRIVVIGEEPEFPAIDTIAIAQREIEIVGTRNGGRGDAARAMALMADGVLRPVIAERIGLNDINGAIDRMQAGQTQGRIVVEFPQ